MIIEDNEILTGRDRQEWKALPAQARRNTRSRSDGTVGQLQRNWRTSLRGRLYQLVFINDNH